MVVINSVIFVDFSAQVHRLLINLLDGRLVEEWIMRQVDGLEGAGPPHRGHDGAEQRRREPDASQVEVKQLCVTLYNSLE